jgi:phage gpG-like protein
VALLRGDFARLEELRRRVKEVASPGFREAIAKRLAASAMKLVADEFRDSKDPYGRGWLPVHRDRPRDRRARASAMRRGNWQRAMRPDKPLVDTGRMRSAVVAYADGTTVRVSIPVEYASFHQYGTRRIPQRQILPEESTGGLGPIWGEAFRKELSGAINDLVGGGR